MEWKWWLSQTKEITNTLKVLKIAQEGNSKITVEELFEEITNEILFVDHPTKFSFDPKWRLRMVEVLKIVGEKLSENQLYKAVKRILSPSKHTEKGCVGTLIEASWRLNLLPFLPQRLKEEIVAFNHRYFCGQEKAKRALDEILSVWMVRRLERTHFNREEGIPTFSLGNLYYRPKDWWGGWILLDETYRGALISLYRFEFNSELSFNEFIERLNTTNIHRSNTTNTLLLPTEEDPERTRETVETVVLLKDVSHPERGYAIRVPPETRTVREAIAWMYQQNPKKFDGFDIEV
jgi:hypothetical protein